MNLLVFSFLFFIPIFVLASELGSLKDYNGETREENPIECINKIDNIFASKLKSGSDIKIKEQLEEYRKIVEQCVTEMGKINPKVQGNENQLTDKIIQILEFQISYYLCEEKVKKDHREELRECKYKIDPAETCDALWGNGGCLIPIWKTRCGFDYSKEARDAISFYDKRQKICVDKYISLF